MVAALSAFAGIIAGIVLCAVGRSQDQPVSRRAWVRLLLWGATGLSLLPGCGGEGRAPADSLLRRWGRVGQVWRDLSAHLRGPRGDWRQEIEKFRALGSRMHAALDALPAWPELRLVFEARYTHIENLLYGPPCYAPPFGGCDPAPQFVVEHQVEQLEELVAEGRLSERAALRAAGVLSIQAEYVVQENEIRKLPFEQWYPALDELDERYCDGTLKARQAAILAGERLVELTVDDLGWLAGPPKEDQGVTEAPATSDMPEEEADR